MHTSKDIDLDALGQAADNTFGRSSTVAAATFSVKVRVVSEDRLQVDYISSVTYASETSMRAVMQRYDDESESAINETLKRIKADYKNAVGKALKLKKLGEPQSSIEPVSSSPFSVVRRGFFRRRVVYEMG